MTRPAPHYTDSSVTLHHGDCLDVLAELPDASVDAVICDPPYGLANTDPAHVAETITRWVNGERDYLPGGAGFMGKAWDAFVPPVAVWDECLRVLKPGGHVLAFAGSRTVDLMTLGLRLAGFDIRDSIAWLYGSGFPKSLDVSKAIDKLGGAAGAQVQAAARAMVISSGLSDPEIARFVGVDSRLVKFWRDGEQRITPEKYERLRELLTGLAEHPQEGVRPIIGPPSASFGYQRDGSRWAKEHYPTAPATDAARTWQGWGTALKPAFEPIVVARKPLAGTVAANVLAHGTGALNIAGCRLGETVETWPSSRGPNTRASMAGGVMAQTETGPAPAGRWPANVVLDESQAVALDEQSGELFRPGNTKQERNSGTSHFGSESKPEPAVMQYGDSGGASRFFYIAKADASERVRVNGTAHPTVKPLALMQWLVRLVTPPGGTVLEPFAGSGTTVEACILEGFKCIAIEREADYLPLIVQRINRRRDPVQAVKATGDDGGLFDLLGGEAS